MKGAVMSCRRIIKPLQYASSNLHDRIPIDRGVINVAV